MSPTLTDQALDVQGELFAYFSSTPGERYAGYEMEVAVEQMGSIVSADPGVSIAEVAKAEGARMYRDLLRTAATYAVSTDITVVLSKAAETIKPYELHMSDLPSPSGFVWLESPIVVRDDTPERKPCATRAFGWLTQGDAVGRPGVLFLLWTDPLHPDDYAHVDWPEAEALAGSGLAPPRGLWAMLAGLWGYDMEPNGASEAFQLLLAFLRFIDEPWLDADALAGRLGPSRSAARRAARAGLSQAVRVVRLRRRPIRSPADETGVGTKWSVRVLVGAATGGFWRNQWYPAKGVHRQRWIWPYEAGAEDAPLVVRDAVYRVDR